MNDPTPAQRVEQLRAAIMSRHRAERDRLLEWQINELRNFERKAEIYLRDAILAAELETYLNIVD